MLSTLKSPWIVAGDWNISPQTLIDSDWPNIVNGVVFATALATCNDNTYDFFVVQRSLVHAVVGVQRLEDGGLSPHWPSRLILRGDAKRFAIRKLVRPPKVTGILPHGPAWIEPSYSTVLEAAVHDKRIDEATVAWYTIARQEWSNLAGIDLAYKAARFKWAPAFAGTAIPWAGSLGVALCSGLTLSGSCLASRQRYLKVPLLVAVFASGGSLLELFLLWAAPNMAAAQSQPNSPSVG